MVRTHGRCLRGKRLLSPIPHGHWHTTTMIASIGLDGVDAPWTLEGAMNTEAFCVYIESVLVPTLHGGEIVVMDNLSCHKSPRVQELIHAAGAQVWYLPPYSPDLNPIEMMWSKVKSILRKAEARTKDELCNAIGKALEKVTYSDLYGWFKHAGYTT